MSEIINISLESDLSEFTSTVTDGGDLYWSADAALAGTDGGMAVFINDTTSIFGEYTLGTPNTSGVMRGRFYLDTNNISMATDTGNYIFNCKRVTAGSDLCEIHFSWSGTSYQLSFRFYGDGGATNSSFYNITDTPHYIEIILVRATSSIASDGYMSMWVDGAFKETISDQDNYDTFDQLGYLKWGATYGVDATTSGTYYIDEIVVNDDGSEIGPVAPAADLGIDIGLDEAAYQGTGVRIR